MNWFSYDEELITAWRSTYLNSILFCCDFVRHDDGTALTIIFRQVKNS